MVNGGIVKRLCCEGARLLLIVGEGRCAFKSRPPLDPLIDIVLSQCMHCPAMTDIVPVENLYIGAPHRSTQIPTAPQRTPHRPVDGQLVDERWSASTQQRATEEAAAAHQDGLMQVLCGQVASATKL